MNKKVCIFVIIALIISSFITGYILINQLDKEQTISGIEGHYYILNGKNENIKLENAKLLLSSSEDKYFAGDGSFTYIGNSDHLKDVTYYEYELVLRSNTNSEDTIVLYSSSVSSNTKGKTGIEYKEIGSIEGSMFNLNDIKLGRNHDIFFTLKYGNDSSMKEEKLNLDYEELDLSFFNKD